MLCSDFEKFRTLAHEDKRQGSQYNNCINVPLLNIQLDKISPPYLHILLGIILKHRHHRLLELAADDIDKTIYNDNNQHRSENSRLLSDYGSNWKTLTQTKEEIAFLERCIALGNADPSSQTWADRLERAQDKLETITHAALTLGSGPKRHVSVYNKTSPTKRLTRQSSNLFEEGSLGFSNPVSPTAKFHQSSDKLSEETPGHSKHTDTSSVSDRTPNKSQSPDKNLGKRK
ncbi:hypothetical protein RRG08_041627 [Elysia crispata]|uniref:Uncharacterized protein n=1 Tax=Elysia crispata TaxID=231223 RepID=A0AAE0XP33_9GAST|nr:hypothetical protein RRG08_041627 [Elysia crispata]